MSSKKRDVSKEISGLLLIVLALLLALSLCRQWLPAFGPGLTALIYGVIYLIPMLVYIKSHRYKSRNAFRLKMVSPKYWLFVLLFGLSVCLICTLINVGCTALFRAVFKVDFQNSIVDLTGTDTGTLILTSVLLPAFAEELLLRGLVQGEYEKYGITIGVLLTSLIFALFHTNPMHIPSLFVAGVCYGVLTVMFRSVWPAILAHAINNGVAVFVAKQSAFIRYLLQDKLFVIIAVLVCFLILIFTLKMLETAISEQLGKFSKAKRSTRSLAYGDPLLSPWLWIFAVLCIGKMVYNGFFK
ncbi:MAG: CPBP family intramembrane metalloprotease [Clostridia bacterium]|nr:CPBP family intramembrane metalloprotease [Clostridia bacterium]MBQ8893229.1 CPBP family intramembrane metalloprotease [Clostridia bacterium]